MWDLGSQKSLPTVLLRVTLFNDSSQTLHQFLLETVNTAQKTLRNFCFSEEKESFKVEFEKEGDSLSQRKRALEALGDGPQLPPLPLETYQQRPQKVKGLC